MNLPTPSALPKKTIYALVISTIFASVSHGQLQKTGILQQKIAKAARSIQGIYDAVDTAYVYERNNAFESWQLKFRAYDLVFLNEMPYSYVSETLSTSGTWNLFEKMDFTINPANNQLNSVHDSLRFGNSWIPSWKEIYAYSSFDSLTSSTYSEYSLQDGWVDAYKRDLLYYPFNRCSTVLGSSYSSGTWTPGSRVNYLYDASNRKNISEAQYYDQFSGQYVTYSVTQHYYEYQNQFSDSISSEIIGPYSDILGSPIPNLQRVYNRNSEGKIESTNNNRWVDGSFPFEWYADGQDFFQYNASGVKFYEREKKLVGGILYTYNAFDRYFFTNTESAVLAEVNVSYDSSAYTGNGFEFSYADSVVYKISTASIPLSQKPAFVSVFPNPAQDYCTVVSEKPLSEIAVFTIEGKCIRTEYPKQKQHILDFTEQEKGFYLVRCCDIYGNTQVLKVLKQ